jgi:type-F conjugative transfer system pilin assembly protein TrbC
MEEKKLLRILIIAILLCWNIKNIEQSFAAEDVDVANVTNIEDMQDMQDIANMDEIIDQANIEVKASIEDIEFANKLRDQAKDIAISGILEQFKELKVQEGKEFEIEDYVNPRASLRIFVSSSMSKELLRQYMIQSAKYGASLVFNGLPDGSFKELSSLIMEISETKGNKAIGGNGGSRQDASVAGTSVEGASVQIDDEAFKRFRILTVPAIVLSKEEDCVMNQSCRMRFDKIDGNISVRAALEKFRDEGDLNIEASELLSRDLLARELIE